MSRSAANLVPRSQPRVPARSRAGSGEWLGGGAAPCSRDSRDGRRHASTSLDEAKVRARVSAIAHQLTRDQHLRKDLAQEAFIHFWHMEKQHPGQKVSWYLKSCRHHLQDFLRSGHSIDALKRRGLAIEITETDEAEEGVEVHVVQVQDRGHGEASAGDILAALGPRLNSTQQAVLRCLSQGRRVQETADALGLTHQAVTKAHQKIRKIALRLGLSL